MAVFVIQGWRGRLYGCRVGDRAMQDRRGGTKVWGLAATLGFAILAFVIGGVISSLVLRGIPGLAAGDPVHNGTAFAIAVLIVTPVQTVTLVLAARLTGTDILAYFGLIVPRWRAAAVAVAALAGLVLLFHILMFAIGPDIVPLDIYRSAQADGTLA
jgi:hypothetical protein